MSRPTDDPQWATGATYGAGPYAGNANKNRPPSGNITEGFDPQSGLPASWLNYWLNNHGQWIGAIDAVGTFTPPSASIDDPQFAPKDSAGNRRTIPIDHNGLPTMGGVVAARESWLVPVSGYTTANAMTAAGYPLWYLTTAGTPTGLDTSTDPGTLGFVNLNTSGNKLLLSSNGKMLIPSNTFQSSVLETDFTMDQIGANSMTVWFGFCGGRDPSSPASGYAWFKKASTDTNWQYQTNDGTSTTTADSGVAPIIDSTFGQRLRVEFHGSASAYGSMARFFVGSTLVGTSTTHLPTANQYVVIGVSCTSSSGTGHDINVGPVTFVANRFASTPNL